MIRGIFIRTEETKQKMSFAHKGKLFSEEHKKKIGEAHKGKHHSEETKLKMSEANKGKGGTKGRHWKLSEETKRHMSESHKGSGWKGGYKVWRKRQRNKRRNLDFIPLNKFFEDAEAHHIDTIYVIYMDRVVHQSIKHSVLRNVNMDTINAVAFNYLNN